MLKNVIGIVALLSITFPNFGQAYGLSALANHPLLSEKPTWFLQDDDSGFYGETENGYTFTQKNVANAYSIRLQRFSIGDIFFYVSDRGIIEAQSDLAAVSVYLTLG